MDFIKWPSIENSYRMKEIGRWTEQFPWLIESRYYITEKLHGSNVVLARDVDGRIYYGSRNQWLPDNDTFFGCFPKDIDTLAPSWKDVLRHIPAYYPDLSVHLFGELIGPGIQKGVNYGDQKRILFFGLMVDSRMRPFQELIDLVGLDNTVPLEGVVDSLVSALEYDIGFQTRIDKQNTNDNLCEGIVIVPVIPVRSAQGSYFMLKKKNEKFSERQHEPKERVPDPVIDPLNDAFERYITDARIQSVFSKEGPITDRRDIGKYIKLILTDAQDDFLKDYPEVANLDQSQQKAVYNVGSKIARMLMNEL